MSQISGFLFTFTFPIFRIRTPKPLFEPRNCTSVNSIQQPNLWDRATETNGAGMEQITQIYKVDSSLDMEWSKQSIKDNYLLHGENNL